jgi:hypothetical protein
MMARHVKGENADRRTRGRPRVLDNRSADEILGFDEDGLPH